MKRVDSQMTDEQLVSVFQKGDNRALDILIGRHQAAMHRMLVSLTCDYDVANDLMQDALIKVFEALRDGRYSERSKFAPWFSIVCRNLFKDYYRKHSKKKYALETIDERTMGELLSDDVEEAKEKERRLCMLEACICKLPIEQSQVVNKRLQDVSFKNIASQMQCSINTSLGRMRYAVINLRSQMRHLVA